MAAAQPRGNPIRIALPLFLVVTVAPVARADVAHPPPVWGMTVRSGTQIGSVQLGDDKQLLIGGMLAIGGRWGPLAIEGEYSLLALRDWQDTSQPPEGHLRRLGINLRLAVLSHAVGERSVLRYWVEAGAGRVYAVEHGRMQPPRPERAIGAGLHLDHGTRLRSGRVIAVGWHLGWRIGTANGTAADATARLVCRGPCDAMENAAARSLTLTSSIVLTW